MENNYLCTEYYGTKYDNINFGAKSEPLYRFRFAYYNGSDSSKVIKNAIQTDIGNIIFTLSCNGLKNYEEYTHRIRWSHNDTQHLFVCFIVLPTQDWTTVYSEFIRLSKFMKFMFPFYNSYYPFTVNRFNEIFVNDRPTRMFLDLDPDSIPITPSDITEIAEYLTNIVNIQLDYIVFKNSNNDGKKHVLFTNLICNNIITCLSLGKILKDKFNYVDTAQYHHFGSLRLLGAHKSDKFKCLDYIVGENLDASEPYFIQPYHTAWEDKINYSYEKLQCKNNIDKNIYKVTTNALNSIGLEITSKHSGNVYNCTRIDKYAECVVCNRVHDKNDSNFVIIYSNCYRVGCFREPGNFYKINAINDIEQVSEDEFDEDLEHKACDHRRKDKRYLQEYIEKVYVPIKRFVNQTIYSSPSAQMPDTINGNCLYLVSPCKTGKTNLIHGYIEQLPANKSICFITCQRLFTTNLFKRFQDLGFLSYLEENFDADLKDKVKGNRVLISINSLHRLRKNYDIIIIDEVETLHSCFANYMLTLGHQAHNKISINYFNELIKSSELCILMDAYPQVSTIQLFEAHGKKVHVHMNEYKMHKDDTIIIVGEIAYFISQMAHCIVTKQPIVFASSLREKQKLIMEQLYIVLREIYKFDTSKLHEHFYNSECDPTVMKTHIDNIDKSWAELDILCYTPSITCGVSFTGTHFSKVFYLGNANSGHISALQALYRVRDVGTREYYITFGQLKATKPIYNLKDNYEYFLNYNREYLDEKENKSLADTLYNKTILSSERYFDVSKENYLYNFIGQFKYNQSTIKFVAMNPEEDMDPVLDFDSTADEVFELMHKKKKEIKLKNKIADHMKAFVNNQPLTEEEFKLLSKPEFDKLELVVNKSSTQKDVLLINTFANWFPQFKKIVSESDLKGKTEMYSKLKKKLNTYHKYYINYQRCKQYAQVDTFDWSVRIEKKKEEYITDNQPERRFIMKCATEVLKYLSGYDGYDHENMYDILHNEKYEKLSMETIQCAFEELFHNYGKGEEDFKKRFFAVFYSNDIRKYNKFEAPYPTEITEWKKMKSILTKVLEQTYNLEPINMGTWRQEPSISLMRTVNLY